MIDRDLFDGIIDGHFIEKVQIIRAVLDEDTCPACLTHNGQIFKPEDPPHQNKCTNPNGCRCVVREDDEDECRDYP